MIKRDKIFILIWIPYNIIILIPMIVFSNFFPFNLLLSFFAIPVWIIAEKISMKYSLKKG